METVMVLVIQYGKCDGVIQNEECDFVSDIKWGV